MMMCKSHDFQLRVPETCCDVHRVGTFCAGYTDRNTIVQLHVAAAASVRVLFSRFECHELGDGSRAT